MNHEHHDAAADDRPPDVHRSTAPEQHDHAGFGDEIEAVPPGARRDESSEAPRQAELIELLERGEIQLTRSENYSGMLPHPVHWQQYDDSVRERILRMSEADTTDESARRDRLVDAEIAEARAGRRKALWIMFGSLGCGLASVLTLQDAIGVAAAGVFIAVPVASVIRDFIRGRGGG